MPKTNDLDSLIDKIVKETKADVHRLSDEADVEFLPTGCYVLDSIMGGGLPIGRITEIFGSTSTGKSLIAAQACAECQELGGISIYIDTEAAISVPIMDAVGVDSQALVYTTPDTVEQVFAVMEGAIKARDAESDTPLLIVWDSIAATSADAEMEKDTGETGYLTHARIISQGLRKLARLISHQHTSCLFINQEKENIGVMWGDKVATFGGKSVGFHSSVRIRLKSGSDIKAGSRRDSRIIGITTKATVVKNKVAPPFREAELPIYFGHGIDDAEASFLFLKEMGELPVGGSWYTLEIEEQEVKFQKKDWDSIYDKHYNYICDLIDECIEDMDLI